MHQAGQMLQAMSVYDQVLLTEPGNFGANHLKGVACFQLKQYSQALSFIEKAIEINPQAPAPYSNLGLVLHELARYEEALASFDRALAINANYAEAYSNRANALLRLDRPQQAIASYEIAIALNPGNPVTFYNLGTAQQECLMLEEALVSYGHAIALNPRYAQALNNRGNVFKGLGHVKQAISDFECAIDIQSNYASAYVNKAHAHLLNGDYEFGWNCYQWRWRKDDQSIVGRTFSKPLWLGKEDIAGKTVLLHAEQGLGDTIQFCRYAKSVSDLGAKVLLEAPATLMGLLQDLPGIGALVEQGGPLPNFDCHCPLLSLPLAFNTRVESIPFSEAYLSSNSKKLQSWKNRLGEKTGFRVGLVWSGNPAHLGDKTRSLRLSDLLEYLPRGIEYVSLQKEVREADLAALHGSGVLHFGSDLQDFSDTAALCDLMDLVVCVDTSVAHLSAAMGKPTWILLPFTPDWRWLLDRDDSPWYSSVKLYRQKARGDHSSALLRVAADLGTLTEL